MVGVLAAPPPAGGRSSRQTVRLGAYLAGMLLTAVPVGAALGALGMIAPAVPPAAAAIAVAATAGGYALHEAGLARLPYPQRRQQVPNRWRRSRHPLLTAFGYGLGLGPGFLVYIRSGTYFAVVIGVVLAGSPVLGAAVFAVVALGRFAFTAGASLYRARSQRPIVVDMARLDERVRVATAGALAANAAFLATLGVAALH